MAPARRTSRAAPLDESGFLYRIRREARAGPLHLGETVHEPGQHLPPHWHARPVLILFLEGRAQHLLGGDGWRVGPGQAAFVPAATVHALRFASGLGRVFSVEFDQSAPGRAALPAQPLHTSDPRLLGALLDAYRRFARGQRVPATHLSPTLIESLRRIERRQAVESAAAGPWLSRAHALVRDGATHAVRISAIAGEVGKHPSHLSRRFRQVFGESICAVRERVRVEAASRALLSERASISTIAADLGFCDHAHLTRSFRRATRMTPREFRRVVGDTRLSVELRHDLQSPHAFTFRPPSAGDIRLASSAD